MSLVVESLIRTDQVRLLLIENNPADAAWIQALLKEFAAINWQFEVTHRLQTALELLQQESYDVILLDLFLPDSKGIETLMTVLKQAPETPVVVATAMDDRELAKQAVHYGAQDFVVKGAFNDAVLPRVLLHSMERQQIVNTFHHAALHDNLTGLANRALFLDYLDQAQERKARYPDNLFGVLFLDLDGFKLINDQYGHLTGDQVLIAVGQRLKQTLRATDQVSRLSGDEFALLVDDLKDPLDILPVIHRVRQVLEAPLLIEGHHLFLSSSMGVALSDMHTGSAREMLANADTAMYQAKQHGKGTYIIFNEHMHHQRQVLEQIEQRFNAQNLNLEHLQENYRPIINPQNGQLSALEVEITWLLPDQVPLPFEEFIRWVEHVDVFDYINHWIFSSLEQQLGSWKNLYPNTRELPLLIQLSESQLRSERLIELLLSPASHSALRPQQLILSCQEKWFTHERSAELVGHLQKLRKAGYNLCLDQSNGGLQTLRAMHLSPFQWVRLPLDQIENLLHGLNETSLPAVILAMVELAEQLGLKPLLDGVNYPHELEMLEQIEGVYAQGKLIAKAQSAEAITPWLQAP